LTVGKAIHIVTVMPPKASSKEGEWAMSGSGYLTSRDLALLKEVLDETCAKNEITPNSPAASTLARALVVAFESGVQDKAGLLALADWGHRAA
jgi:hypothetical protein